MVEIAGAALVVAHPAARTRRWYSCPFWQRQPEVRARNFGPGAAFHFRLLHKCSKLIPQRHLADSVLRSISCRCAPRRLHAVVAFLQPPDANHQRDTTTTDWEPPRTSVASGGGPVGSYKANLHSKPSDPRAGRQCGRIPLQQRRAFGSHLKSITLFRTSPITILHSRASTTRA